MEILSLLEVLMPKYVKVYHSTQVKSEQLNIVQKKEEKKNLPLQFVQFDQKLLVVNLVV